MASASEDGRDRTRQARRKPPLLWMLLGGIVVPCVLAAGAIEYLAWQSQTQTVDVLVNQLQKKVGDGIQERVTQLTEEPADATVLIERALERGSLSPTDVSNWEAFLFDQGIAFRTLSTLYFANATGDFAILEQKAEQPDSVSYIEAQQPKIFNRTLQLEDGNISFQQENEPFDPIARPWYRLGSRSVTPQWSATYDFYSTGTASARFMRSRRVLGITLVRPYFDPDSGEFAGVIGADITLTDVNRFLETLRIGQSGEAFIFNRNGELIASSLPNYPSALEGQLLTATETDNPLIRQTGEFLIREFGGFENITQDSSLSFESENERQLLSVRPFTDEYGLDWVVAIVVPESDFTGNLKQGAMLSLLLSGLIFGGTALLVVAIARRISRSMFTLSQASEAIAKGDLTQQVNRSTIRELDVTAVAFNDMGRKLKASYAKLEDYSHSLEVKVEKRTNAIKASEARYRSLFEDAPIPLWEHDFSDVKSYLSQLKQDINIDDMGLYLSNHHEVVTECIRKVQVLDVNQAALDLYETDKKEDMLARFTVSRDSEAIDGFKQQLIALANGRPSFQKELVNYTLKGNRKYILFKSFIAPGYEESWGRILISVIDISQRRRAESRLEASEEKYRTLNEATQDAVMLLKDDLSTGQKLAV